MNMFVLFILYAWFQRIYNVDSLPKLNFHYFLKVYKFLIEHFYLGQIVWPKYAKIHLKKMPATPKSSTYEALQPKPWVVLKNLIYHFVHYNLLNKSSVHHNSVGSIFFELHHFFPPSDTRN